MLSVSTACLNTKVLNGLSAINTCLWPNGHDWPLSPLSGSDVHGLSAIKHVRARRPRRPAPLRRTASKGGATVVVGPGPQPPARASRDRRDGCRARWCDVHDVAAHINSAMRGGQHSCRNRTSRAVSCAASPYFFHFSYFFCFTARGVAFAASRAALRCCVLLFRLLLHRAFSSCCIVQFYHNISRRYAVLLCQK